MYISVLSTKSPRTLSLTPKGTQKRSTQLSAQQGLVSGQPSSSFIIETPSNPDFFPESAILGEHQLIVFEDVSYRPRFPIVGQKGIDLADKWKTCPEAYLGLAVPDMPNMILFIGPSWPVENGSVMGPLGQVAEYAIKIIKKMQREQIHSIVPKQDVTDAFNEHTQQFIKGTVRYLGAEFLRDNNRRLTMNCIGLG